MVLAYSGSEKMRQLSRQALRVFSPEKRSSRPRLLGSKALP